MDLNKVMLIGRLTRDPQSRTIPTGATVANFGLATGRSWKDDQGNQKEVTEFHNIVAWRRLAEICAQYLKKGQQIYIEGHLQTRTWDGQDGKKNYRTEVVADNMIMLGSKSGGSSAPAFSQATRVDQSQPQTAANSNTSAADQSEPNQTPVDTVVTDEEIRIEDIPF